MFFFMEMQATELEMDFSGVRFLFGCSNPLGVFFQAETGIRDPLLVLSLAIHRSEERREVTESRYRLWQQQKKKDKNQQEGIQDTEK